MLEINGMKLCNLCFSVVDNSAEVCPHCGSVSNTVRHPSALPEGTIVAGKYTIGMVLGKGGFGITYLSYDLVNNRKVAIKECMPSNLTHRNTGETYVTCYNSDDEENFKLSVSKFYEEASLVAKFNGNPNIISVYEFFRENNSAYFVMEYLDGLDLKHYIRQKGRKIEESEAIYILNTIVNALLIVHSTGILHRDISPDNIFITNEGNVKIMDFGAARQVLGEASKSLSVILKQGFAPLEQYQKKGNQGPWTDIYALGASVYCAVTGKIPDDAMSRLEDEALDMSGISPELATIIQKMLSVKIENRFHDIFELKNTLTTISTLPQKPQPDPNYKKPLHPEFTQPSNAQTSFEPVSKGIPSAEIPVLDSPQPEKPTKKFFTARKIILFSILAVATIIISCTIYVVFYSEAPSKMIYHEECPANYSVIKKEGMFGLVDNKEKVIIPCEFDEFVHFYELNEESYAMVEKDDKLGLYTLEGEVVLECIYDSLESLEGNDGYESGANLCCVGNKYGIVYGDDNTFRLVIPAEYDGVPYYKDGYATVIKEGKYGFVTATNDYVTDFIYEDATRFSCGFASVKLDGKWGIINTSGAEVLPCILNYDFVNTTIDGIMFDVNHNNKWGGVNLTGAEIVPVIYDDIIEFVNGHATVSREGLWGCVNTVGQEVVPCSYATKEEAEQQRIAILGY